MARRPRTSPRAAVESRDAPVRPVTTDTPPPPPSAPRTVWWPWALALPLVAVAAWVGGRATNSRGAVESPHEASRAPRWGGLELQPFYLEVPPGYYSASMCAPGPTVWRLPRGTLGDLRVMLDGAGVEGAARDAVLAATVCNAEGCVVTPSEAVVTGLAPRVRESLYARLGRYTENPAQAFPFRRPASEARWSVRSGITEGALLDRLVYPRGTSVLFSDLNVLCARLHGDAEKVRVLETLSRMSALMVWVKVTPESDIDTLVDYWARGAPFRDIRPVLESVARVPGGGHLDVVNLLPPFARRRMNTYPAVSDPPRDCYWTALNFFSVGDPVDVFVAGAEVEAAMVNDYDRVPFESRGLGDVIFFVGPGGVPVHAVNHVAGEVVFTKNGGHFRQPWVLTTLDAVQEIYPDATERRVYRRRTVPATG